MILAYILEEEIPFFISIGWWVDGPPRIVSDYRSYIAFTYCDCFIPNRLKGAHNAPPKH